MTRDWDRAQSQINYLRRWQETVGALARAQYENRVKDECLALAVEALGRMGGVANGTLALGILTEIKTRLAELEPKEETE